MTTEKYIYHSSGLPIRIPPYLRSEMRKGNPMANLQADMMRKDPRLGIRGVNDVLPANIGENVRLRKIAHHASRELVQVAQNLDIRRYATIVHGSVSKGLVRHPCNPDPSDVDISLVIDGLWLNREQRRDIAKPMTRSSVVKYGVKTDIHIWTMDDILVNKAELARIYLRSAAYSIANEGKFWEQIRWIGLQCEALLRQNQRVRQKVREVIPCIAQGNEHHVQRELLLRRNNINFQTYQYLVNIGLIGSEHCQLRAQSLLQAIK